jgi:hypothetical protein
VKKEIRSGTLLGLEVEGIRCERDLHVVLDRRRVLPLPARLFLIVLETSPVEELTA